MEVRLASLWAEVRGTRGRKSGRASVRVGHIEEGACRGGTCGVENLHEGHRLRGKSGDVRGRALMCVDAEDVNARRGEHLG